MTYIGKKWWRIPKIIVITFFTIVFLLLVFMESVDRFFTTDYGINYLYRHIPREVQIKNTDKGKYLEIGDKNKPLLMFIHGAPGGMEDWSEIAKNKKIYEKYRLIIPYRPGYGNFRLENLMSIEDQAKYLMSIVKDEPEKVTILGHSYGAPVAIVMGALFPEKISRIIAASGQYDLDNEKIFSISYYIKYPIFKYILPRYLWKSNQEKLGHYEQLTKIVPLYKKVSVPVLLLHGTKDGLVPVENSIYLKEKIKQAQIVLLPGADHPLPMTGTQYLIDAILYPKALIENFAGFL